MNHRESALFVVTPKTVIGLSLLFLVLASLLGVLNSQKVKTLHTNVANAAVAHDTAERRRAPQEPNASTGAVTITGEDKLADAERKAAKAETELTELQKEKADLQSKLDANQNEIAALQKRVEDAEKAVKPVAGAEKAVKPVAGAAVGSSAGDLQSQLDDARRQLDSAEKEKAFLSEKLRGTQNRSTQVQEDKKRRESAPRRPGLRGTVLAVNQAYNFVVLNLGSRQGVEPNSELLVLREGTLIGKIRISSVEPTTAIGDIITGSLGRGVQVQPGDTVVYAGTNS